MIKLKAFSSFLGSLQLTREQQRYRHTDYILLRSRADHHEAESTLTKRAVGILPIVSILTVLLALPLCIFFHTFSTIFFYLSLFLFALPLTFVWLAPWTRTKLVFVCSYLLFLVFTLCQVQSALDPSAVAVSRAAGRANTDKKVFIASNLHNNQDVLPYYSAALQQLVQLIGVNNTYVSIYESHSSDKTKPMLSVIDHDLQQLGVPRRILMDDKRTKVGLGQHRNGRIDFLAYVRNVALEPLKELFDKGQPFTHVLWINDVYFQPNAILQLLDTDAGRYDQACALDFIGNGFYDIWVMRDVQGETAKRTWPYFANKREIQALRDERPFLVNACWNGVSAFDARWYLNTVSTLAAKRATLEPSQSNQTLQTSAQDVNPDALEPPLELPLRFRSSPRCFSSECQLMSFDIHRAVAPLRPRIWINPRVKVAYEWRSYFQYVWLERWWLMAPWRILWRDGVAMATTRLYPRWPDFCKKWQDGWAAPDAELAAKSFAVPTSASHDSV